jgi:hypothetical protein
MKITSLLLIPLLLMSCGQTATAPQVATSSIVAHVYFQTQNISGVKVELVQSGKVVLTDNAGLAEFQVPPGSYDIQVYGIQGPGPAPQMRTYHLTVDTGQTVRVEVFDCLYCV